nr:MAG TPA: hypothetical protein [Caudoviricetes sp.]
MLYRGVLIDTGSHAQTSREFLPEKFLRFEKGPAISGEGLKRRKNRY